MNALLFSLCIYDILLKSCNLLLDSNHLFILFFLFFIFFIVVDFFIHWNETAMGLHVFPIPIPPPTSLSTQSL